jgi:hypothetical protein
MRTPIAAALLVLASASPCGAKSHLWRFTEFFSNASGTVQFIEMQECCGSVEETQMTTANITTQSGNTYTFPNDISGSTAHRWILIATQSFANLPGAPTPDFIIPPHFFDPHGDRLRYRATLDIVNLSAGALPLDGFNSLDRNLQTGALTAMANSPINFAGGTGTVTVSPIPVATPLAWLVLVGGLAAVGLRQLVSHERAGP